MNAAQQITVTAEDTRDAVILTYRWTQFQVTATWENQPTVVSPIAAMTREDAAAYARNANKVLSKIAGFVGVKLSLVNRKFVERVYCTQDLSEDGDGSPITHHEAISGERWGDWRSERNFNAEAHDAADKCVILQTYYRNCGR